MTDNLKPCPWCNGSNIKVHAYGQTIDGEPDAFCQCHDCTVTGPNGTNEAEAIAAWNRRTEPAGSADQVNDAVEMVDDSPGIVWKVTFLDGSSCHYGVKSTAQAAAGKCGTIEAIELKDKRFRPVEACSSAMSTQSTHQQGVSIKAGEIDLSDAEIAEIAKRCEKANLHYTLIDFARAVLLAAKGWE